MATEKKYGCGTYAIIGIITAGAIMVIISIYTIITKPKQKTYKIEQYDRYELP